MDRLGQVAREYLRLARANDVRNATAVASEFQKEGMSKPEIEEMLFASGFDADIVKEVLEFLPGVKK